MLSAPDSVLRLIAVEGVRLERHIYLILPTVGETSPAARRLADQLLRIHPAGSQPAPISPHSPANSEVAAAGALMPRPSDRQMDSI